MRSEVARSDLVDVICLAIIGVLAALPYVQGLGFYSDDWYVLRKFEGGVADALWQFGPRPLHGLYLAALFEAFGFAPLGYHLVNSAVLIGAICLLFTLLRELRLGRPLPFAVSVIALVLPQVSTVRVWVSASQIPLSMLFALASMHWHLRFARTGRKRSLLLAVMTALLSVGAYELFAPLIVAFGIVLTLPSFQTRRDNGVLLLSPTLAIVLAGLAKAAVSPRLQTDPGAHLTRLARLFHWDYDWRTDYGLNLFAASDVNFAVTFGGWSKEVAAAHVAPAILIISAVTGAIAYWRVARDPEELRPRYLLLLGLFTFTMGYGVFLLTDEIMFSPSGIANRVSVAAAVGVAMIIVSLIAFLVRLLPTPARSPVFASVVAGFTFVGAAATASSASYWTKAAKVQLRFLQDVRRDLRAVPAGSTVIVDGVCPYQGPAIVLEDGWGASGAVSHALGRDITADGVSPRMQLEERGFATSIYNFEFFYPFGESLFLYDARRHRLVRMPDASAAKQYFQSPNRPPFRCPRGYVGQGVLI